MPSGSPKIRNRNPEIKTESKFVIKKDTINLFLKLGVLFKENDLSLQFLTLVSGRPLMPYFSLAFISSSDNV